jgi:hypothetical protein
MIFIGSADLDSYLNYLNLNYIFYNKFEEIEIFD